MKDLQMEDLTELNSQEMRETTGGLLPVAWLIILGLTAIFGFGMGLADANLE